MANIKLELTCPPIDGQMVTFKAPCDCTAVTGLKVCYPSGDETVGDVYTFRDAHGNDLTGLGNLFLSGVFVMAILDTTDKYVYLQNADTNKYLEQKTTPVDNLESTSAELALSAKQGNKLNEKIETIKSHIGMIIHTTKLDTEEKVKAIYGGTTWVKIEGRFLLGQSSSYAINSTGGEATHTLTANEMPSHKHTFSGTAASHNHGLNNHTHSIPVLSGTAASAGTHLHHIQGWTYGAADPYIASWRIAASYEWVSSDAATVNPSILSNGAHTHSVSTSASTTGGNSGNTANTSITPSGTISNTGDGGAHNNMPPYKTVYIWERTV